MPKLQVTIDSSQDIGKRKRLREDGTEQNEVMLDVEKEDSKAESTALKVPTKTLDGGKKPQRIQKSNSNATPLLRRNLSFNNVASDVPWPDHFTRLETTHRALNIVYTFCCTRKHLATTFENIKSAVEAHIKRELKVEDVAQIKALVPNGINFAYVDESMLEVQLASGEISSRIGRGRENNLYEPRKEDQGDGIDNSKEVLLFEFVDGDLKRQVRHAKTGEPTNSSKS
jgi:DEAD/DEAH box helicase domain-containing protein